MNLIKLSVFDIYIILYLFFWCYKTKHLGVFFVLDLVCCFYLL